MFAKFWLSGIFSLLWKGLQVFVEEIVCCESQALPAGMVAYCSPVSGAYVAACNSCRYVNAYWECVCELVHNCEENEN